jgi:hypothetical protein
LEHAILAASIEVPGEASDDEQQLSPPEQAMKDKFVQCSAERKRGDALIRCQLHAGHDGEHKWPGEQVDRQRLVDEIAEWVDTIRHVDTYRWSDDGKIRLARHGISVAQAIRQRFGGDGVSGRVIAVSGCNDCPFLGYSSGRGLPSYFCEHPSGAASLRQWDPPPYTIPDKCPLRAGSTVVRLAKAMGNP